MTCMSVPKYCVFLEFTVPVRKMCNLPDNIVTLFCMNWTNLFTRTLRVSLSNGFFTVCSQHLSFQGAGGGVTMGSKGETCVIGRANAEKSELLAR